MALFTVEFTVRASVEADSPAEALELAEFNNGSHWMLPMAKVTRAGAKRGTMLSRPE